MLNQANEPWQRGTDSALLTLSSARRVRRSPLTERALSHGASTFTTYNHMLLPSSYQGVEDYHHLKRAVQVWDVCAERQVEIAGPDAAELVQLLSPRDLRNSKLLKGYYAPICAPDGGLLNDPIILRPDEQRWWLSIADTDVLLYALGVAAGRGLNAAVHEPDVHPIAVQGPKAGDLMERVFGTGVRDLKFFGGAVLEGAGTKHVVVRSGWSGQGGFEIFVEGTKHCEPLWDALFEAGANLDVRPGSPNGIERIESGLLSYGNDMTINDTPFECGLGCYIDADAPSLARQALAERATPTRRLRGLLFDAPEVPALTRLWRVTNEDTTIGEVRSAATSPDHGCGIAIAMIDDPSRPNGTQVSVEVPELGMVRATVHDLPLKP